MMILFTSQDLIHSDHWLQIKTDLVLFLILALSLSIGKYKFLSEYFV